MIHFQEEVYQITKELVQYPSIVGTIGERNIAYHIYEMLEKIPYFQEHPSYLKLVPTIQDDRERYNVLALIKGADCSKEDTVILMGHIDTVGVEDYGKWKRLAFSPDELLAEWKKEKIPASVQADLATGNWLPGRGVLDMKSGVAINIALIRYFAEHYRNLQGNILFVATCDEENNSRGILSALKEINYLSKKEKLRYIAAINQDYTSPRYDGDPSRYIYLGTVGKLLPSFFVVGKETHVGQAFEGFDPNLLLSELTHRLDYNPECCDEMFGEVTLPPVSLKQTDLKQQYDVQTPGAAFAYYNFFVHSWSPQEVLERLRKVAMTAFEVAISKYQSRYRAFCELSGQPYQPIQLKPRVYTYEEFYNKCRKKYPDFERKMLHFAMNLLNDESLDLRDYSRRIVEELWKWGGDNEPAIILFYSSYYIPRVVLSEEEERGARLIQAVKKAVQDLKNEYNQPLQIRKFFPYISDMSFVAISDSEQQVQSFEKNMPAWGLKHPFDMEEIRKLDVPVINIGPYGKDAHKPWERVEIYYSMQIAPNLTYRVIQHLFQS
ncbi:M20/M25/M40 family metallo-hydrolase [Thermoflavimicrobium dichotomicum]|uniref:Arginine utilization protein RocB n=1 Tax=Thermoflavimicrobium dichotomicum TaxID=46223 RepID=A0A1I3NEV3_9BACL|nr:M20/M25/M40 family metallo-hydrolase [Thermoflavimicrobium dichotomicum]SFJ07460.1 Arginine utilization protein RocB [Thermoflavimicrobium dichotomicum]